MLIYCLPSVCDAEPSVNQHWFNVSWLLDRRPLAYSTLRSENLHAVSLVFDLTLQLSVELLIITLFVSSLFELSLQTVTFDNVFACYIFYNNDNEFMHYGTCIRQALQNSILDHQSRKALQDMGNNFDVSSN